MTMTAPEPGTAVDPMQVIMQLRQQHAQRMDAADYQIAQLTVALNDAQATIGDLRIRAEELARQNSALSEENAELRRKLEAPATAERSSSGRKPAGS